MYLFGINGLNRPVFTYKMSQICTQEELKSGLPFRQLRFNPLVSCPTPVMNCNRSKNAPLL